MVRPVYVLVQASLVIPLRTAVHDYRLHHLPSPPAIALDGYGALQLVRRYPSVYIQIHEGRRTE